MTFIKILFRIKQTFSLKERQAVVRVKLQLTLIGGVNLRLKDDECYVVMDVWWK